MSTVEVLFRCRPGPARCVGRGSSTSRRNPSGDVLALRGRAVIPATVFRVAVAREKTLVPATHAVTTSAAPDTRPTEPASARRGLLNDVCPHSHVCTLPGLRGRQKAGPSGVWDGAPAATGADSRCGYVDDSVDVHSRETRPAPRRGGFTWNHGRIALPYLGDAAPRGCPSWMPWRREAEASWLAALRRESLRPRRS